ncbi:MAG: alpha/beta hydrolase [Myxococcales bacterium]
MTALIATAGITLLLVAWVSLWARRQVAWLKQQPDPYESGVLEKGPDGVEELIDCPDGTKLRAVSKGSGPAVVFVHGFTSQLIQWSLLWSRLSGQGLRLIAFDMRGHGESTVGRDGMTSKAMAGDIATVLEHFDVRDGVLVGHSLGGFISIVFLTQLQAVAKARLRGAVLVSAFAGAIMRGPGRWGETTSGSTAVLPVSGWRESVAFAITRLLAWSGILRRLPQSNLAFALERGQMGARPSYSAIKFALSVVSQHDLRCSLPIAKAAYAENHYPTLKTIELPCVVVCGDADTAARPFCSERLAGEIRGARAVWVKGAGHFVVVEEPEPIAEAIRSLCVVGTSAAADSKA